MTNQASAVASLPLDLKGHVNMANIWNERRRNHGKRKSQKSRLPNIPLVPFPELPIVQGDEVYSEADAEMMARPAISREEFVRVLKKRGYTKAMIQNELDQLLPGWELIDIGEETPEEVAEKRKSFGL